MGSDRILLIVYHSQSGATEQLASAVEQGALRIPSVEVVRLRASSVMPVLVRDCRVLVVCSPEYFGYMAGAIKDLFDRTYEEVREHTTGKAYTAVICAGNDGSGALASIERIIAGYRMKRVQKPIVHRGPVTSLVLDQCKELGETLAAGIDLGIF
jgi:multimeric flavodoxin WrbA